MKNHPAILVLDAMGVIYPVSDDVRDLLVPFIQEHGGEADTSRIEALYRETSLGRKSARDFWRAVGLDPELEEKYLRPFKLTPACSTSSSHHRRRSRASGACPMT